MLEKNWVKSADKLAEYYRTMRQESERLSRLVENVLDFARLQRGRKRYAFELGDLNECIGKVVEMMRPYAEQHGFTISTDLGDMEPTSFDKDAVTQIVVNLIDNAVKYACSAADRTITVRTRTEAAFTVIEVEDHGPGIPHRRRKKVFDQFYRIEGEKYEVSNVMGQSGCPLQTSNFKLDTSNAPQPAGTGLGLTLVKRFAEAHGGGVEVRSAEPTGTILRVSLTAQPAGAN
jgi:signal transduction histidine kinase